MKRNDYLFRKARLIEKGYSLKAIARKCRVSQSLVTQVVQGKRSNRHVQLEIARRIGQPVDKVFPRSGKHRSRRRAA